MVYGYFNNWFTDDFGSPALNLTPITICDRPLLHKIAWYIPDLLPVAIYIDSENSASTLTNPYDLARLFLLPSDDPKSLH